MIKSVWLCVDDLIPNLKTFSIRATCLRLTQWLLRCIFIKSPGWAKTSSTLMMTLVTGFDILPEVHISIRVFVFEAFDWNPHVSLTRPVCLNDFWTEQKGFKVFQGGYIGDKSSKLVCSEECVSVKMMDGVCDQECNTLGSKGWNILAILLTR